MKRLLLSLVILLLPVVALAQSVGGYPNATSPLTGTERMLGDQSSSYPCVGCTVDITPLQIADFTASQGTAYGLLFNNNGVIGSIIPGATGQYCLNWTALNAAPTLVTCTGGGSTWPSGGAGIPNYTGLSSWGTSYSATNTIPANFISAIPVSTGISGLGTGVGAFLGSPTATNLGTAVTGASLVAGSNVTITGTWPNQTINATAGGGGVSSLTGDGALITNSGSTGGVTLTLGNTGVGYGVWGNTTASSGAPGYHALSTYPTAAFPTLNQNTTGTAANITGTSNGTLTTLSALSSANGSTVPATAGTLVGSSGTFTLNDCLEVGSTSPLKIIDTGAGCGSGGGGSAFNAITSGTNTAATMTLGTGGTLTFSGTGVVNADEVNGAAPPASAAVLASNASSQLTAASTTGTGSVVLATSPALTTPNLGTPSAITLTNGAGLPISTGVSGLGTGVATFLATPSSANLASAVTGETGTGALVFATSPTLVTPALGTPSAAVLTNATGLPPTTGIVGWPANAAGVLTNNGTGTLSWGSAGSGTVTDGSGTTTANEVAVSTSTAHVLGYAATLPTAAMPALTGDVTNTAGSLATTVGKVNGGAIPASANCVGTNSSSQFTAGCPEAVNAQVGTTYTVATTDCGGQITFNNAASIAVTVPQATGSFASCQFDVTDIGAGTATLTPTTSTINGSASLAIAQNRQCTVNSDGTNWQVIGCTALVSGGSGTPGGSAFSLQYNNSGAFGGLTLAAGQVASWGGTGAAPTATSTLSLGVAGTTVGGVALANATSGTLTLQPGTGALGSSIVTFPAGGGTIPYLGLSQSWTGSNIFGGVSFNGGSIASVSPVKVLTNPFTGGTGTTTVPVELFAASGTTAVSTWNTAGTFEGINAPSGFTGNLFDYHVNGGTSVAKLDYQGNLTVSSCTGCTSGGGGTVTSVGLTTPSWLTVGGSPVTTAGTLAVTATTGQTANQFLATPNGTTGAVGLRAIVAADIPTLNQNTTGSAGSLTALSGLPTQAADTIVANATGSSASPTAVSVSAFQMALLQASTKFTAAGTGCTVGTTTGGATAGTFVLAAGPCTSVVITMNGGTGLTAPNGWHCDVGDRTLQNAGTWWGEWPESSSTTTTATIAIPAAAGATDTISFHCSGF